MSKILLSGILPLKLKPELKQYGISTNKQRFEIIGNEPKPNRAVEKRYK